jgi:hypothetical protein
MRIFRRLAPSQNEFLSIWRVLFVFRINFFQLAKLSRTSINKDEARRSERESSTGVFTYAASRLIRVAPHAARWSGPRHALVMWIWPTRRTSPGRGRQALLICRKPAIRGSAPTSIVIGAPLAIGRCGFVKADDGRKHTKGEEENPHGNLSRSGLSRRNVLKPQIAIHVFYSRIRDEPPRAACCSRSGRMGPSIVFPHSHIATA